MFAKLAKLKLVLRMSCGLLMGLGLATQSLAFFSSSKTSATTPQIVSSSEFKSLLAAQQQQKDQKISQQLQANLNSIRPPVMPQAVKSMRIEPLNNIDKTPPPNLSSHTDDTNNQTLSDNINNTADTTKTNDTNYPNFINQTSKNNTNNSDNSSNSSNSWNINY